ncbi:hypothetical protein PMZ80_006561 [Knufia obscura]|uniref:Uncharacterized protein n=2 Tax=Knufia TaxID=430999 RepID=A0AAN8ECI3_9EURO|nr:hypothetical protein PMZ80_006561 [Knufia obscura]KAK5950920.1 hypothetical protein OHC33_007992 [Knufia fluminis]
MDEDIILPILFLCFFILFPFGVVFSVTACIAASRTRVWKKKQASQANIEAEPLAPTEEEEDDFLDTEDEADYHKQKVEERADMLLTPRQKFRKELKKAWSGNQKDAQKQREREERRKLAKAVAREVERRERRRNRQENHAAGSSNETEGLPSYNNAVAGDRKQ